MPLHRTKLLSTERKLSSWDRLTLIAREARKDRFKLLYR